MAIVRKKKNIELAQFQDWNGLDSISAIIRDAKNLGFSTIPFDIERYVKSKGISIIKEEMEDDISGYIEYRHNQWVISVNMYQNPRRQRFTMAHEFAHFLFDRDYIQQTGRLDDILLFRNNEKNHRESRANEFAGNILMPSDHFLELVNQGITSFDALSRKFNVSAAAIRYRAFKLGLTQSY